MKHLNILIAPVGEDGCSHYRIKKPYTAVKNIGEKGVEVVFISNKETEEELFNLVSSADIIVFRQCHYDLMKMIVDNNLSSAKLVVDFDDDIFNMCPYTDAYRIFGLEEVEHDGKMLWKDGYSGFDIKKNREEAARSVEMIKNADLVTVTTEYLGNVMKEIGAKEIAVFDNGINFNNWKKWNFKKHSGIRIGWTGGATHYIDWFSIKDALKRVFDKYKGTGIDLKLVIQGAKWDGTLKGIDYEFHDWIAFDGHPYKTASLDLDIAVIPLADTKFNDSKSCIKWYEFSALGVPSLVSNVLPYSAEVNKDTALTYDNEEEFEEKLCRLIEDEMLRETIGNNAYKWVRQNKNIKDIAKLYIETLWNLKNK
jgi:glycosyltransferase involved in cell wall biosynthesis